VEGYHRALNKHFLFSVFKLDDRRFGATFSDISIRVAMERELETRARNSTTEAQDATTALKVMLKQNVQGRRDLEEQILSNLNEMTRPYLDRLAISNLSRRQRILIDAVNSSLSSIASPLGRYFMLENIRLSPTESRVSELIRLGKSTKQIGQILGVATSTIDFHRHNIRRKLKLNRSTNLQSYLQSLQ
jgi:DNA-binding CsgD family transcriptional regulator